MILGSGLLTKSGKTTLTLYTTKSGTFNPTIAASDTSGIVWDFGDGSATYTGGTPSHSYADSSQKTVRVTFDDPTLVTQLNFSSMSMAGEWPLATLAPFTALTTLQAHTNTNLNISGALTNIPTVTYLRIYLTASTITGNWSDFNASATYISIGTSQCAISGALSDLPNGITDFGISVTNCAVTGSMSGAPNALQYMQIYSTASNIDGGTTPVACVGLRLLQLHSSSTTQANIDSILARLYADRANFTYATPVLNVGGTNPNPTGTYADATPPTTGLEYAYKLVNDPDAEGFKKWAITY